MIAYCINLQDRPDKWEQVQPELGKLNINVLRWNATKLNPGYDGCRESHLALLEHARYTYPDELIMVLEDDVEFVTQFPWHDIKQCLEEVPHSWDVLYLGATLNQPLERWSSHLFRLKKGWTTHAMIFNNQNGVIDFILENRGGEHKIDVFYANVLQENFKCFISYPLIANQRNGYSDILKQNVRNGDYIRDFYKLHTGGNLQ